MNKYLNIFYFFNNNDNEFIEDNLLRGFVFCLKYDMVLFDKVLKFIFGKEVYELLFNIDYFDYMIEIDL